MKWKRGKTLGQGASGMVSMALVSSPQSHNDQITLTHQNHHHRLPSLMAVKSAPLHKSRSLFRERRLLQEFQSCPHILRCFGAETTTERGTQWHNIFLEYASGGSLADRIQNSGGVRLPESEVRRYTKSVLEGLSHIHGQGYVHCDIKPHNILLVETESDLKRKRVVEREVNAKIADFGIAMRAGQRREERGNRGKLRGTPMYIAPESVVHGEYETCADIWGLGCTILQLMTGKDPWKWDPHTQKAEIVFRIGFTEQVPEIPSGLPKSAQDFLKKCLVRDPKSRWTADMLLDHPFVSGFDDQFVVECVNRIVLPKFAEPVCDSLGQSSFGIFPKPHQVTAHSGSDGVSGEDSDIFPAFVKRKRMEKDEETVWSRTSFELDALGRYWGVKRVAVMPNSSTDIVIFD
ncbi:mitogen-activated protein kinase kinase kinase 20-like [Actinidia eriantha]|uniref:mitogen-activated protein kinase kinase kinase 20-like n=1 Tax=Actinidia eriantha TaxID=165200 RepID=UPI00258FE060|nr:mitogen-activated protein kinase kinase kinase 20-like [Actinidia eriantha]